MSKLIRNIWAVGRNFADHAKEMQTELTPEPMIFLKSGDTINTTGLIRLPDWSNDIHHEIEIAFWLNEKLELSHLTLALDLTARDAQTIAKNKGQPWTKAKSFTGSCPLGPWIILDEIKNLNDLELSLKINNQLKQKGFFKDMIFKPNELLISIKKHYPVQPHDVILTGTPAGVGALKSGDKLEAQLSLISKADLSLQPQPILVCHWDVN